MKTFLYLVLWSLLSRESWAQQRAAFIDSQIKESYDQLLYSKADHSSLAWGELDPTVSDIAHWKRRKARHDKDPLALFRERERRRREGIGRIMAVHGKAYVLSRYPSRVQIRDRSLIREGEGLETGPRGHVWVYLFSGALLRLAPNSHLSFKEFAVGRWNITMYARLNKGHVLYINRPLKSLKGFQKNFTDTLFHPLKKNAYRFQNPELRFVPELSGEMRNYRDINKVQYYYEMLKLKANKAIQRNSRFGGFKAKNNYALFVLPNASFLTTNSTFEIYHLKDGKTLIKKRPPGFYYESAKDKGALGGRHQASKIQYSLRGDHSSQLFPLEENKWFKVPTLGSAITELRDEESPQMFELISKRLAPLFLRREEYFERYSRILYSSRMSEKELLVKHGFRLWEGRHAPKQVLYKKLLFHLKKVQPYESINIFFIKKLNYKKGIKEVPLNRQMQWRFHGQAMQAYHDSLLRKKKSLAL